MDSDEPWVPSVVKIEIDIAEELPVSMWTEKAHQGQGAPLISVFSLQTVELLMFMAAFLHQKQVNVVISTLL